MQNRKDQQRFAQSASALGAGILGFGLGAKWGFVATDYALVIMLAGALLHVGGMYVTQMRNISYSTDKATIVLWYSAWACLALLVSLVIYLLLDS